MVCACALWARAGWEQGLSITAGWTRGHGAAAASSLQDLAIANRCICFCTRDLFPTDPPSVILSVFRAVACQDRVLHPVGTDCVHERFAEEHSMQTVKLVLDQYPVILLPPPACFLLSFVHHLKTVSVIILPQDIHHLTEYLRAKNRSL